MGDDRQRPQRRRDDAASACSAAWLFVAGVDLLVLPAIAAGALVKVPLALIAPMLFVGVWRRNRARAIEGALLAVALAAVVYRPFWEGPDTLTALRRTDLFTASLGSVLRLAWRPSLGLPDATGSCPLGLAGRLRRGGAGRRSGWPHAPSRRRTSCGWPTSRCSAACCWPRPGSRPGTWSGRWRLGAALAEPRRHLEVALLSLGGLLQYFVFIYLWVMGVFPPYENLAVQTAAYLCIVGPLLLGVLARARRRRDESCGPSTEYADSIMETTLAPRARKRSRHADSWVFFDGEMVRYHDVHYLPPMTHALHYGTGCFEGIRAYWNAVAQPAVLAAGRGALRAPAPLGGHPAARAAVLPTTSWCAGRSRSCAATSRAPTPTSARWCSSRPKRSASACTAWQQSFLIYTAPLGEYIATDGGIRCMISSWRRISDRRIPARAKITGSYVNSALAKSEALENGYDEAIMLTSDGHVSEGSAENLFMLRDGVFVTPPVTEDILEGITRELLIGLIRDELGLEVVERTHRPHRAVHLRRAAPVRHGRAGFAGHRSRSARRWRRARRAPHAAAAGPLLPRRARRRAALPRLAHARLRLTVGRAGGAPFPLIDIHTHLMPERLFQAVRAYFRAHLWHPRYDAPDRRAGARRCSRTGSAASCSCRMPIARR